MLEEPIVVGAANSGDCETWSRQDQAIKRIGRASLWRCPIRRKVVLLAKRGYIYRSEEGYLYLTTTVGNGFEDMTARLVEDLPGTARRLELLLADRPTSLGPLRLD